MKYIGIDLGTTNSAICSYDGEQVRLYKSPEQNDVTPSAIFFDKRGNKYLGARAYEMAAMSPDSSAIKFKKLMGTSTPIKLTAVNQTLTPEACSAEILRCLFGYLPEEIRHSDDLGTVITVPAAFNQMQKTATLEAAKLANLPSKIALMQEPVAAVMSVMRQHRDDGVFLIFDLGGGTLDIAIAQSTKGRVSLLAHGGRPMCGGTDFDRAIVDSIVKPYLQSKFQVPENLAGVPQYQKLLRLSLLAAEKAKISLSAREEATISVTETDLGGLCDAQGTEIYLDLPLPRSALDELIADKINEGIQAARETLGKAGLKADDVEKIVFIGGPTQYKPLRDRVSFELGVASSTELNPMTAVAEGAAVFAESLDWASESHVRKSGRGTINAGGSLALSFNYQARTPDFKAKVAVKLNDASTQGLEFQIDSLDTGWTSGRLPLRDGAALELNLAKPGENTFKVFVYDSQGGLIQLPQDRIVISRTAAAIDAIPASHSIGLAAKDKVGGAEVLVYLVREGDQLPKKGQERFKADKSLKAGSREAINFQVWEGEISDPITDNLFIGLFEIRGTDFDDGVIAAGADLICEYEALDSGLIILEVTVPSIRGSFRSHRNLYSRREAQLDYSRSSREIAEDARKYLDRLADLIPKINDLRLSQARTKLKTAEAAALANADPESVKQAMEQVQEVKRTLAAVRQDHLQETRQMELDRLTAYYNDKIRQFAQPSEAQMYDNLLGSAQRAIEANSRDFESHLKELGGRNFKILWRQEWFVVDRFRELAESAYLAIDENEHGRLVSLGEAAIKANDIDQLREVVCQLYDNRRYQTDEADLAASVNIVRS